MSAFFDSLNKKKTFSIALDYSLSAKKLIAAGHYNLIDPKVKKIKTLWEDKGKKKKVILKLLRFNKPASIDQVLESIQRLGYRPATLGELLTLGATYDTTWHPIIAMGTSIRSKDGRDYALIWGGSDFRNLGRTWGYVNKLQFSKRAGTCGSYFYAVVRK